MGALYGQSFFDRLLLSSGTWSVRVRVRVTDKNKADGNSERKDETNTFVSFHLPRIMTSVSCGGFGFGVVVVVVVVIVGARVGVGVGFCIRNLPDQWPLFPT